MHVADSVIEQDHTNNAMEVEAIEADAVADKSNANNVEEADSSK